MEEGKCLVKNPIYLTYLNGTAYVFNADDYMRLRTEHRIIGALVGTCNTRGWSANESTLPVELTPCETRLLIEQRLAVLVSKQQTLLRKPTASELQQYNEKFEAHIIQQADASKAEKLRETERNMEKILAGKRKKLIKEGFAESDINLNAASIMDDISANFVFERKNVLLEIHCAHPEPHLQDTYETVQLPVPESDADSLKYRVFRDFWLRGKYVTAGDAFGADFLLYPGDPLLYHASHIVILLPTPVLKPLELIAKVRLSVIVNKICIFAYFDVENVENIDVAAAQPKIRYQTVLWEGNRDKEKS